MGDGNHVKGDSCGGHPIRTATLAGPVRPLRRDADDRPRRDDRQRRPPDDSGGPRLLAERPRVGGQRVLDRIRRPAPAVGSDRGPDRPAAHFSYRARRVHVRLAAVRTRPEPGRADRRAVCPGRRRSPDLRADPGDDRDHVPGAAGAGEGDRRLHVRCGCGRLDRAAAWWRAHRDDQLALDLLRQHPDRAGDRLVCAPAGPRSRGDGSDRRGRRPGGGAPHRRPDALRLHDSRGG